MKQGELMKLGGSLEVPDVQELAKEPMSTIPPRYVHPDQDPALLLCEAPPSLQLPLINFHDLCGDDDHKAKLELERLHLACKDWGFFQLVNHGVDSSLLDKTKSGVEGFFNLPIEEKKKFRQEEGDVEGYGQAFVASEEQKLDWADMFYVVTLPTRLRKPHLFPRLPLHFRETLEEYSVELKRLAMKILLLMAKALGIKGEEMSKFFDEGTQSMRMNYYPPCPQPELAIGFSAHSDGGVGLTILLQVNEQEGLQIKKDGLWIPIKPLPNAFIVNIGDMLEIVTNGIYPSIEHRATVNSEKERLSIATFLLPDLHGDLGPAPSLISSQTPPLFKTINAADFLRVFYSGQLKGKAHLDAMRISSKSSGSE